ncbi:NAD(P)/FAD-dependent oxidoreductase [Streptacidiphilus sp. ASG 303]|uniref:FAD-dependent oxidoreductase n=1 Tax=Streptacidiphilus sp. ASG 303 TaxID=2896847 RepID=UPI001E431CA1|nr:FAD-dependent oxidoreductase [Streptacidiphilus sp. ASG 303]MCD0484406.1 NAD(P)/FAD-dependent oxidoreductase [Streptacidiphilus sp. ASG 303]
MDVVVVGAGQAGLSAAYHLLRRGFAPGDGFVVLDADDAPGGAWRHRSPSLTMAAVHGFHNLPGLPLPPSAPDRPAREAVPEYFAAYERTHGLPVLRPVRVRAVRPEPDGTAGPGGRPGGRLLVETDAGAWSARALVNATGTWTRPFVPYVPGAELFRGRLLHYAEYRGPEDFRGLRVAVVGGGASAVQVLAETAAVAETLWVTRRPPVFRDGPFTPEAGRAAVALVEQRVREGLPARSVVGVTGLTDSPALRRARELGALERQPMFDRMTATGVAWADGRTADVDAVVWATGFRPAVGHLAPLGLREPGGGIRLEGTRAAADPRVHLVGYGPSASTVGATRAGRAAARELHGLLRAPVAV